jgi:hypothetical protein
MAKCYSFYVLGQHGLIVGREISSGYLEGRCFTDEFSESYHEKMDVFRIHEEQYRFDYTTIHETKNIDEQHLPFTEIVKLS